MKIAIFANDDMTSNLIFAPLFNLPGVQVVHVSFAAGPRGKSKSMIGGALSLIRRMSFRYWLFLVSSNGLFKIFETITLLARLKPSSGELVSVRRLAQLSNVSCDRVCDFSAPDVAESLKTKEVDLLIIRVGAILRPNVLDAARIGTWCVHSSLLPSFAGIAGEFHALRHPNGRIGSTVFEVTPVLDAGPPLAQIEIERNEDRSLLQHIVVNNRAAGQLLASMVAARAAKLPYPDRLLNEGLKASYFSWPSRQDVAAFRRAGKRLCGLRELAYLFVAAFRLTPSRQLM